VSDELARRVVEFLEVNTIAYTLIGATAVGRYGVTRATMDVDFFVVDSNVLKPEFWNSLAESVQVDCRRGDFEDALRGLVRLRDDHGEVVDVVVGKWKWQSGVVERSEPATIWGRSVPVVRAADLILLKLYAGGGKDAWDITELLAVLDSTVVAEVEQRLPDLQQDARDLWRRIRHS
jgi:predicted nucleotidyltransferase